MSYRNKITYTSTIRLDDQTLRAEHTRLIITRKPLTYRRAQELLRVLNMDTDHDLIVTRVESMSIQPR